MVQLEVMQSDESRQEEWRVGMVGGSRGGDGGGVKREMVLIKVSSLSVLVDKHFKKLCR